MSKEEFLKLLYEHDWYYQMSDDVSIWTKGSEERKRIKDLCKDNPEFMKLYVLEGNKQFFKY